MPKKVYLNELDRGLIEGDRRPSSSIRLGFEVILRVFFKVSADSYNFRFRSLEALRIKNYTNALCQKYLP